MTEITRRAGLIGAAGLLAAPWVARAPTKQLTVGDNGGPVGASIREAFYDPFEKATAMKIANVTQAVDPVAMIKIAVNTKAYTVDGSQSNARGCVGDRLAGGVRVASDGGTIAAGRGAVVG